MMKFLIICVSSFLFKTIKYNSCRGCARYIVGRSLPGVKNFPRSKFPHSKDKVVGISKDFPSYPNCIHTPSSISIYIGPISTYTAAPVLSSHYKYIYITCQEKYLSHQILNILRCFYFKKIV